MVKKLPQVDDEMALFQAAMADVTPLKKPSTVILSKKSKNQTIRLQKRDSVLCKTPLKTPPERVLPQETLSFQRAGLQHKLMTDLRQGRFPCEAVLDLHHLTWERAKQSLDAFLHDAFEKEKRCVRVIHGKGERGGPYPLLKNLVNEMLREYQVVLAFHSAPIRQGGVGAVNILLRRQREAR